MQRLQHLSMFANVTLLFNGAQDGIDSLGALAANQCTIYLLYRSNAEYFHLSLLIAFFL